MNTRIHGRGGLAGFAGPFLLLLLPKCPLCLLPIIAAVGINTPPSVVMNVLVVCISAGWTWFVFRASSSRIVRAGSIAATALLVSGRTFKFMPITSTYAVAAVMLLMGVWLSRRCIDSCAARQRSEAAQAAPSSKHR